MDDNIQGRSALEQKLMEIGADRALSRNGLAYTSPLRDEMLRRGQIITGDHEPAFRVRNDEGTLLTADGFIAERRRDPRYAADFPPEPPRVSKHDQEKLRANFDKIRSGEAIVG